uniref:NADH dehydrogenase subunit 2 n=1 Tax=Poecilochirus mrciaki TaxID=3127720 RepID=UPI0030FF07A7
MFSSMNFFFFFILIMTTLMAISAEFWFQLWVALEINMMMFLPLMFNKDNLSINSMMKYFLVQAFASSMFIFTMIISHKFMWVILNENLTVMSMLTKLGMFPVFFWFPQVSEGLSWFSFTLLSTWQKIIPLYVISSSSKMMFTAVIIASALAGCLGMLNQSSLRKMFAYSSMTHMSWMLLGMMNSSSSWFTYFSIYSIIMVCVYMLFKPMNMSHIDSIKIFTNPMSTISLVVSMMSLSGLPPFLGFFPKWMMISGSNSGYIFILFVLIISSLVSTFVYLRMLFPLIFNKNKITKKIETTAISMPVLVNSLLMIPLCPLIFF